MNKTDRLILIAAIVSKGKSREVTIASLPMPSEEVAIAKPDKEETIVDIETYVSSPSAELISRLENIDDLTNAHESSAHESSDILTKRERAELKNDLEIYRTTERKKYWLAPLSLFRAFA